MATCAQPQRASLSESVRASNNRVVLNRIKFEQIKSNQTKLKQNLDISTKLIIKSDKLKQRGNKLTNTKLISQQ